MATTTHHPEHPESQKPTAGAAAADPKGSPLLQVVLQPMFLVVALVLLVAAVALNGAVGQMQLHFRKEAVPLATYGRVLTELPQELGPWRMVSTDVRINEEVEHALGTKEYIFRDYVDSRVIPMDTIEAMREMPIEERRIELARIAYDKPAAVINLAVTYYTGLVDTVAHIPDRCYIADGYEPSEYRVLNWETGSDPTPVRYINFEDQTSMGKVSRNVAYFFFANDEQTSDPLGVRQKLQNLFERHGYYAKVELMIARSDADTAEAAMIDFLTAAKPEIRKCLPDWERVKASEKGGT